MIECCDNFLEFGQKHIGKVGVLLGVLGVSTSVLVSLNIIVASGVVLGITNLGIIVGAVCYDTMQSENDKLKIHNQNLQEENTALSNRISVALDSPRSLQSVEPVNFNSIHTNKDNTAPPSPS